MAGGKGDVCFALPSNCNQDKGGPENREMGSIQNIYPEKGKNYAEEDKIYAEKDKIYAEEDKIYAEKDKIYAEKDKIYADRQN